MGVGVRGSGGVDAVAQASVTRRISCALSWAPPAVHRLGVEKSPVYDTAGSAKMISEGNLQGCASIASDLAAAAWGMEVLERNIEDDDANFTRFLLLSRQVCVTSEWCDGAS